MCNSTRLYVYYFSECMPPRVVSGTYYNTHKGCAPQSTEVFYLDHGETANGPIEKVYVTTLVTPMGLASSFNGGIFKIIVKKWANFENSINHHKNGLVWCM